MIVVRCRTRIITKVKKKTEKERERGKDKDREKETNDFYVVDKNLKSNEQQHQQQLHDHPKEVKKSVFLIYNLVD